MDSFLQILSPSTDVTPSNFVFVLRIFASLFFTIALFFWLMKKNKKDASAELPPGPKGLPFLGFLPGFTTISTSWLMEMKKKYGDIFSFKYSGYRVVFLGNQNLVKEALVTQGSNFAARSHGFSVFNFALSNSGILTADGELWQEHKRFAVQALRDFGLGRTSVEGEIVDEVQSLLKRIETKHVDNRVNVEDWLAKCSVNITTKMLYNQTYDFEDPEFFVLRNGIREVLTIFDGFDIERPRLLTKFLPWMIFPGGRRFVRAFEPIVKVLISKLIHHDETFDENHIRDYYDSHISRRKQAEASGDKKLADSYTHIHAATVAAAMIIASIENQALVAYWGLYFLAKTPEVQKKVQKELDEVVGTERQPCYADLPKLPYTEAVMNETFRIADLIPLNFLHENYEETILAGYKIPKRSLIIPSLNALHHDPKYWSDPTNFNPGHFLDSEGKKVKKNSFMPFSTGRRLCPGENLSRMFLFHVLTSMLQKYSLEYPEDQEDFPGTYSSAVHILKSYDLIVEPRKP